MGTIGTIVGIIAFVLWLYDRDEGYQLHLHAIKEANSALFRLEGLTAEAQRLLNADSSSLYLAEALSVKERVLSIPSHTSFEDAQQDLRHCVTIYNEDLGELIAGISTGGSDEAEQTAVASRLHRDYSEIASAVYILQETFISRYPSRFRELLVKARAAGTRRRFRDAAFIFPLLVQWSEPGQHRAEHSRIVYEQAKLLLKWSANTRDISLTDAQPNTALFGSRVVWLQGTASRIALASLVHAADHFVAENNGGLAGEAFAVAGSMHFGIPFLAPETALSFFEGAERQLQNNGALLSVRVLNGKGSALILLAKQESSIPEKTTLCERALVAFENGLASMARMDVDDERINTILEVNRDAAISGCQRLGTLDLFY